MTLERMVKMPDSKTIGTRIKNLRESKHYSQEKLGELVGVSTSTISMSKLRKYRSEKRQLLWILWEKTFLNCVS